MKTKCVVAGYLVTVLALIGCREEETKTSGQAAGKTVEEPANSENAPAVESAKRDDKKVAESGSKTVEDAKKVLLPILTDGADQYGILDKMAPTDDDLRAIFTDDMFDNAKAYYAEMFSESPGGRVTKEGQTALLVWAATTEELQKGEGDSRKFPGGYRHVAEKLKPGLTFFRFKFVAPGSTTGMAFDGLTYVNDHWVWVPKPWRALR